MAFRYLRVAWTRLPYTAAVLLSLVALASTAMRAEDRSPVGRTDTAAAAPAERLREGTRFNGQLGHFKPTGDRLTFYVQDGERRLLCLENLNLERIARMVRDNTDTLTWSVSGTLTECQGANYLLVTQATQLTRPASPAGTAALETGNSPRASAAAEVTRGGLQAQALRRP